MNSCQKLIWFFEHCLSCCVFTNQNIQIYKSFKMEELIFMLESERDTRQIVKKHFDFLSFQLGDSDPGWGRNFFFNQPIQSKYNNMVRYYPSKYHFDTFFTCRYIAVVTILSKNDDPIIFWNFWNVGFNRVDIKRVRYIYTGM